MSIGEIIFLTAAISAFVIFMAVLAWGDYHVRQAARRTRAPSVVDFAPKSARWPQEPDDRLQHAA